MRKTRDKTADMRVYGAQSALEKTDRILGQDRVKVILNSSPVAAPAFTDGINIYINAGWDPVKTAVKNGFDPKSVLIMTGLNYHELAHCMFTPRMESTLVQRVKSDNLFMAMNALEDQLAETRFVSLYNPARYYFSALVSNFILNYSAEETTLGKKKVAEGIYPLIAGRLYLPVGMRNRLRNDFNNQFVVDEIDRLVAEYKQQIFPHDDDRMYQIIKEFDSLLRPNVPPQLVIEHNLTVGSTDDTRADEAQAAGEFVDNEEGDKSGSTAAAEGDQEEDAQEGDEGGGSADKEGDEGEDEGQGNKTPERAQGNTPGEVEDAEPTSQWDDDLQEALERLLDQEMDEVHDELDNRIESIQSEARNYQVDADVDSHGRDRPNSEQNGIVQRCIDEFRAVEIQHSPGWDLNQRQGKLNPRKYAKALRGDEYIYKKWHEGVHNALDFEVVFMLDQSGSMSGDKIKLASLALWILRRTFDEYNGTTTILGFSQQEKCNLLAQRNDRASSSEIPMYPTIGSTYVNPAIREADRILSVSHRQLRFGVIISDGGFNDPAAVKQIMKENPDLRLAFIGIEEDVRFWSRYPNTIHAQTVQSPMELVPVVQSIALGLSDRYIKEHT